VCVCVCVCEQRELKSIMCRSDLGDKEEKKGEMNGM